MNYEDALKIADEKLGMLFVQYENTRIPSLRWRLLKELSWFAPLDCECPPEKSGGEK